VCREGGAKRNEKKERERERERERKRGGEGRRGTRHLLLIALMYEKNA
jgi:hypothetical protein